MSSILPWILAHFVTLIALVTLLGTGSGLLEQLTTGKVSAFFATLSGAMVDLVKVAQNLYALFFGGVPPTFGKKTPKLSGPFDDTSQPIGGGSKIDLKSADKTRENPVPRMRFGMLQWMGASLTAFFAMSLIGLASCGLFTPKNTTDAVSLLTCVIGDAAQKDTFEQIVTDCQGATVQIVEDIVGALIAAEQNDAGTASANVQHLMSIHHAADGGAK